MLVESSAGTLLWNASIVAVAKNTNTKKIRGYRVHYKKWSSRFDEWVDPVRVVEPSHNNLLVQVSDWKITILIMHKFIILTSFTVKPSGGTSGGGHCKTFSNS